jgi:hypothetical protein
MEQTSRLEYHKVITVEHKLESKDVTLIDTIKYHYISPADDRKNLTLTIKTHTRMIGDKCYATRETLNNENEEVEAETWAYNIDAGEESKFLEEWESKWIPQISEEEKYKNNLDDRMLL